jgi:hypothetical protein
VIFITMCLVEDSAVFVVCSTTVQCLGLPNFCSSCLPLMTTHPSLILGNPTRLLASTPRGPRGPQTGVPVLFVLLLLQLSFCSRGYGGYAKDPTCGGALAITEQGTLFFCLAWKPYATWVRPSRLDHVLMCHQGV